MSPRAFRLVVGRRLARLRDERGLTQHDLAQLVHVSDATITRYETGARGIKVEDIFKFAAVLGVHPADFFPFDDRRAPVAETTGFLDRLFYEEFAVGFGDMWQRLTPFEQAISLPVIAIWRQRASARS